jgi:hypothetical protein
MHESPPGVRESNLENPGEQLYVGTFKVTLSFQMPIEANIAEESSGAVQAPGPIKDPDHNQALG